MKKIILSFGLGLLAFSALLNPVCAFEHLDFGDGFISDNANIISDEHERVINKFLWELHNRTTADIAVVTVNSLQGQTVENTALQIGRTFKVGAKGVNNGVVLLVAPNERNARIEVGYGLETVLPNSYTRIVMDKFMIPYFKTGDYSSGIYNGSARLARTIATSYGVTLNTMSEKPKAPSSGTSDSPKSTKPACDDYPGWAWFLMLFGAAMGRNKIGGRGHFGGGGGFGGSCGASGSW